MLLLLISACKESSENTQRLPFFGQWELTEQGDTIRHSINPFSFLNQDSVVITEKYLRGKITVVDFFFSPLFPGLSY